MKKILFSGLLALIVILMIQSISYAYDDEEGEYLGEYSSNPYDSQSVSNPYGQYGSPYSSTSVNNPYSQYGSPYSSQSVNNPYTTEAPVIVYDNNE